MCAEEVRNGFLNVETSFRNKLSGPHDICQYRQEITLRVVVLGQLASGCNKMWM